MQCQKGKLILPGQPPFLSVREKQAAVGPKAGDWSAEMLCTTRKPFSVKPGKQQLLQSYQLQHYMQHSFKWHSYNIDVQLRVSTQSVILILSNHKLVNVCIIHNDSKLIDISSWENKQRTSLLPPSLPLPIPVTQ